MKALLFIKHIKSENSKSTIHDPSVNERKRKTNLKKCIMQDQDFLMLLKGLLTSVKKKSIFSFMIS